ncbi:MAG TPA: class I SAM-dependent methyltransferase [Acidimicrobiales bacterium]|jgi:hypothetical protein|nr:class I SAM-dependent methyltransferase [Acidimicrobiales bacterium]
MATTDAVRGRLSELHEAVWELAAIALALQDPASTDPQRRASAEAVLVETGFMENSSGTPRPAAGVAEVMGTDAGRLASQASTAILQTAGLLSGAKGWQDQDDQALLAQGRASAQGAPLFKAFAMDGLGDLLSGPSPAMLDVGVGVAALAVAYCEAFPGLSVVGLDVSSAALRLAGRTVDEAGMSDRVELRHRDVAELDDRHRYCLAWLPAPFVPPSALHQGLPRIVTALVPGGWLVVGHGKFHEGRRSNAISRFQTTIFGGTALDDDQAQAMLRDAGLEKVFTFPTPPGTPGITVGRRAARAD